MPESSPDLLDMLSQGSQGQFQLPPGLVAQSSSPAPTVSPAPLPPVGDFRPSVPPPTSPDQDAAMAAAQAQEAKASQQQAQAQSIANSSSPAATTPGLLDMLDAGAKGSFKPTTALLEKATPGIGPQQSTGRMLLNSAINGPFQTLAPFGDFVNSVLNLPILGVNAATGTKIPTFSTDLQPPMPVNPSTEGGRMASAAVSNLTGMLPMMGAAKAVSALMPAESMIGNAAKQMGTLPAAAIPSVMAGGAAGQLAADAAPDKYKELANLGANIIGGGAEAFAQHGVAALGSAAAEKLGQYGIGLPVTLKSGLPEGAPALHATTAQARQATAAVREAGGANLAAAIERDPLMAARDEVAAKLQKLGVEPPASNLWEMPKQRIGQTFGQHIDEYHAYQDQNTRLPLDSGYGLPSPADSVTDLTQQLHNIDTAIALRGNQYERVPGESPTTLQVAPGQPGVANQLQNLDVTARRNPKGPYGDAAFRAQEQQQNAAQIAAIKQLASITDPHALATAAVNELAKVQDQAAQARNALETNNAQNFQAFRPGTSIEEQGETVRSGLEAQMKAERARVSGDYFDTIDPNGTLTHTMLPAKQMANILLGRTQVTLPPDAPPAMQAYLRKLQEFTVNPELETTTHPAELQQLELIARQPDQRSYRDTQQLLSNIEDAKNTVAPALGFGSRSMTRLRLLQGSLMDSMSTDLAGRIQAERAAPPDINSMPLEEALAHFVARQTAPAAQPDVERLYAPPPAVSEKAAEIQRARQQWRDVADRYQSGPVGAVLAKGDYGRYNIQDLAGVMRQFMAGGEAAPERMARLIDAANGDPEIMRAAQDFTLGHVQRQLLKADGSVDVAKYERMQATNHPLMKVINMFPTLKEKLGTAAAMQNTVDQANAAAAQAVSSFRTSELGRLLGRLEPTPGNGGPLIPAEDPAFTAAARVRSAVGAQDPRALLQLADQVKDNPGAFEALKNTTIQEMVNRFAPANRAGPGMQNALIDRKGFRDFMVSHKPALIRLFGGQGYQHLDRVAASLQDAERAEGAKGISQVSPLRLWALAGRLGSRVGAGLGAAGATLLGEHALGGEFGVGAMAAAGGGGAAIYLTKELQEAAAKTGLDLKGAMMRYPAFYREMNRLYPARPGALKVMQGRLLDSLRAITQAQLAGAMPRAPRQATGQ